MRFTVVICHGEYTKKTMLFIKELRKKYNEFHIDNYWNCGFYVGVNSYWKIINKPIIFELQFHTPESLNNKQ